MVGFPGEKEDHFQNTMATVKAASLAGIHVFPYSPRRGTPAAIMPDQVPAEVKKRREASLLQLGRQLASSYARQFLDETLEVLVERPLKGKAGVYTGHTPNYLAVAFASDTDVSGQLLPVKLLELKKSLIWGKIEKYSCYRQENRLSYRINKQKQGGAE
jgi:threonylcarbamoyladenosine tRNA methylthiotransferase MtaB